MAGEVRQYSARARSTDTFGRALFSARNHHHIVDGPVENGCPGEEVTPGELFLGGVATCGVELIQVIAREREVPLRGVRVAIAGVIDRGNPVRRDVSLFNSVRLELVLEGVNDEQGAELVDLFKRR